MSSRRWIGILILPKPNSLRSHPDDPLDTDALENTRAGFGIEPSKRGRDARRSKRRCDHSCDDDAVHRSELWIGMRATETVASPISQPVPMPKPSMMMSVRSAGRTA
jgi:hypothetical protein